MFIKIKKISATDAHTCSSFESHELTEKNKFLFGKVNVHCIICVYIMKMNKANIDSNMNKQKGMRLMIGHASFTYTDL